MLPHSMQTAIARVGKTLPQFKRLPQIFAGTFTNTYSTTLKYQPDGSVFVITGDIPAMWLRDSAAQVKPYLRLAADDTHIANLIAGVVKRQCRSVLVDPYANAFNESANGHCHNRDDTTMGPWIWERKYELDSLCAPLQLAHDLWKVTGHVSHLDAGFSAAARLIVATIKAEQHHATSRYSFQRHNGVAADTLAYHGRGSPVADTGMSWSGFRPSDDACHYHYLVPSNMLASVVLAKLAVLPFRDEELKSEASTLSQTIKAGIERHGKIYHAQFGEIYAYETDGLGHYNLMDDANVPSLLAMPYMGYCKADDNTYQATRAFALSRHNPHYFSGKAAQGIGSPHTPEDHIWPISLCMQALTSQSRDERVALLETLLNTDAGTGLMHESFHKDDPDKFTRPWFAWANSLFAEFVLDLCDTEKGSQ